MIFRNFILPVFASVLILAPVQVLAEGQNEPDSNGHQHQIWTQLKLTDDQKAKLKDLYKDMKQIRTDYAEKAKALREKAKTELLKSNPSKAVLYGYAKELGDLDRVLAEKRADHFLKAKTIFTADQFTKIVDMQMAHDGMWKRDRKDGPDGPHHEGASGDGK